jgi:hypothetical protein
MTIEAITENLSFDAIDAKDLEAFHRHREKLLTAVCERIACAPAFETVAGDDARTRIAHESAKIFIENFHATAKYRLPGALLEYLDWLRGYLRSREFPPDFLPGMLGSLIQATHAFMEHDNSDDIAAVLTQLKHREKDIAGGAQV